MSSIIWVHKFNNNELGIKEGSNDRRAGPFCYVPKKALNVFFPNNSYDRENNFHVTLYVEQVDSEFELKLVEPPAKKEYRLSLAGEIGNLVGTPGSELTIQPGKIGVFLRKGTRISLSVFEENSDYKELLDAIPSSRSRTNAITEVVIAESELGQPPLDLLVQHQSPLELYKPFLILAGISGTGKTRFVRQQAMATGSLSENYCLTPVRPDWHEPSDLLGYTSRLSGQAEYVSTDVLMFIAKAWRAVVDQGLSIQVDSRTGRLVVRGQRASLAAVAPYWLCLDEMNLAPVEQYFADYLSVLETQEWRWQGDSFSYTSDALLNAEVMRTVHNADKLRADLGFQSEVYDSLWKQFCQYGMGLPFNLIVTGTVNMDETTHGFSRKVLDRALTLDFGAFFPNNFDEFFEPNSQAKALSYPTWSVATPEALSTTVDTEGQRSTVFLKSVNAVLVGTTFQLAFRALNELYLAVISAQPQDEASLYAVWDDFMMSKVLPRIEGDADKLGGTTPLLTRLITVLEAQLTPIWATAVEASDVKRPDLYRESLIRGEDDAAPLEVACRAQQKLVWMRERLDTVGFTSFWP